MVEINTICDRIIFLINDLKINKKTFANAIEHSPGNVTDWTKSRKKPSKKAIRKICEVFNVSQLWLETGDGNIYSTNINYNNIENTSKEKLIEMVKNMPEEKVDALLALIEPIIQKKQK